MNFYEFLPNKIQNGLKGKDDETVTHELIQALSKEMYPRVIIENFP